jgi:dinuclear metal center YbgI/SA1388 family protein
MTTSTLSAITDFLDDLLKVREFQDAALNGLQIESPAQAVTTVAVAVDAGLSVLTEATARKAELLIVHHGLFWGGTTAVTGALAKKVALCMNRGLSLYAAHLPLDAHIPLGNAAQVATYLGGRDVAPCYDYRGKPIGVQVQLPVPMSLEEIAAVLSKCEGVTQAPLILPFGARSVSKVGIATGSATSCIPETVARGLDLLITGEPKQESYHAAKDLGCSVICMGHYASETFGVRALERVLRERFGVQTTWINEPTGI